MPRRPRGSQESPMSRIESSIRSIDAKMKLLAQRLKVIEMNEQVIGRTLVSHNKKLKELESRGSSTTDLSAVKAELRAGLKSELLEEMKEINRSSVSKPIPPSSLRIEEAGIRRRSEKDEEEIKNLKKAVSNLKQEVDELKYVMESVNPMEYVTISELGGIIDKKIEKAMGSKKKKG